MISALQSMMIGDERVAAATYAAALDRVAIVAITDLAGTIVYANEQFEKLSKYSKRELVGQNHRILNSGYHPRAFFVDMYRTIGRGKIWRGEVKNRAKDGSFYWVDTWIVPLADPTGTPIGYVSIRTEITSRKALEGQLRTLNVELRHQHDMISHLEQHDGLTGLRNLVDLDGEAWCCDLGQRLEVLFIDVDGLKAVNDTLGHATGDGLLKKIAERLQNCVPPQASLFKFGGDEFVVVLKSDPGAGWAKWIADQILETMRAPVSLNARELSVSVSIGIAEQTNGEVDANRLLTEADLALRAAKSEGRNCFRSFVPEMEHRLRERRQLESDLSKACANGEIQVEYQPIVDARGAQVVAYEALVRWDHPTRGRMAPAEFIPLAEETGLIHQISACVLSRACADALDWPSHIKVTVNLSAQQFQSDQLIDGITAVLNESGLPASRLELEVTESLFIGQSNGPISILRKLRQMGITIALDDFGTGYSSLSYLRRLPIDVLKIDRTFVVELATSQEARTVLEAICNLADRLGMATVIEGIETEEQAGIVRQIGGAKMQGFLFGRPQPAGTVAAERTQPLLRSSY